MQLIALVLVALCVEAYYLYGYLSFKDDYCGTFASLDDKIGWVLKASTASCIKSGGDAAGANSFSSSVHIDAAGFRVDDREAQRP